MDEKIPQGSFAQNKFIWKPAFSSSLSRFVARIRSLLYFASELLEVSSRILFILQARSSSSSRFVTCGTQRTSCTFDCFCNSRMFELSMSILPQSVSNTSTTVTYSPKVTIRLLLRFCCTALNTRTFPGRISCISVISVRTSFFRAVSLKNYYNCITELLTYL